MQKIAKTDQIWEVIEPLCASKGLELIHVECQPEAKGLVLRLFIDKSGGVTLEDCTSISREGGDLLDTYFSPPEVPTGPAYRLEVSSPGLDRPLGRPQDFKQYKGSVIKLKKAPLKQNGKIKTFKGVLLGLSEQKVQLCVNEQIVEIPYQEVISARLIYQDGDIK